MNFFSVLFETKNRCLIDFTQCGLVMISSVSGKVLLEKSRYSSLKLPTYKRRVQLRLEYCNG